jgi:hypothetical protein
MEVVIEAVGVIFDFDLLLAFKFLSTPPSKVYFQELQQMKLTDFEGLHGVKRYKGGWSLVVLF